MKKETLYITFLISSLLIKCSSDINLTGAGSETTNSLMGKVFLADNSPASSAHVQLIPSDYDAVKDGTLPKNMSDITDEQGRYSFKDIDTGSYVILARSSNLKKSAIVTGIEIGDNSTTAPGAVLKTSGSITVTSPDNNSTAYAYIPGTDIYAFYENGNRQVVLENVPSGIVSEIVYSTKENPIIRIIRSDIELEPGDTAVINNPEWRFVKKIHFNTTSSGASIKNTICNFPVLIRLSSAIFDFSGARKNGADIRFTKPDNTFLPFEIENWDSDARQAEIWVKIDTLAPNSSDQFIIMYWGNPDCISGSDGGAVFDTSMGFQGVWHLGEPGNMTASDATYNRYDGTPYGMSEESSVTGITGKASDFNGVSSHITMAGTADGKLNFPEDGSYSISLWVYADTADTLWHGIAGKGHRQYYLQFKCFNTLSPSWEFVEYQDETGWEFSEFFPPSDQVTGQWVYLAGVRDGNRQMLYLNGEMIVDTILLNSNELPRVSSTDFTIGCHFDPDSLPALKGFNFFNGKVDEVRVVSSAPDAEWIRLCYMNQKIDDALVEFR